MSYGMGGHVGICFQESFGTSYTSSMFYFPVINESLAETIPSLVPEGLRGRFEAGSPLEGAHSIAGDIVFEGHPILLGIALKAWTGQASSVEAEAGSAYYTHTFKPRTSDFDNKAAVPPMSIECYRDAGSSHLYSDCLCEGLVIETAYGAIQKVTLSVVGGNFEKLAQTTPSYLAGSEFTWDQTSIELPDGTAVDELSTLSFTAKNSLEGKGTIDGTKCFSRIKRSGFRATEIAATMLFENDTEFDKFRAKSTQAMKVTTTGEIICDSVRAALTIDIPCLQYREFATNLAGPGQIEATLAGDCLYDTSSATMFEITLVNTQETY